MSETRTCPECGGGLPPDAPAGLCPRCLWDLGAPEFTPTPTLKPGLATGSEGRGFGNYELLEEVARGGMGVVYKARQRNLGRVVALKVIRPERLTKVEEVERFRREAAAAATLRHPNLVAVHEAGEAEGQQFYSMDFVEGRTLAEVAREGPLPVREAAACVQTVAEAIHYAHERGVLHRDLKPSNILLDDRGQPHVTDFGLAKVLKSRSDLTLSGQVLGSPSYMAPEQASGRRGTVDARTDVYALGAILYELLSGRPPFQAETSLETLKLVVESEPVSPSLLNPGLPRDLETICLKCLEKSPARRYANAQMVADELGRYLDRKPILARPVSPAEKLWRWCQRKPLVAALAAALLLACLWSGLSTRQLRSEKVQRAIDAALTAALGGDRSAAEQAIHQAEQQGAPREWVRMLQGQVALHTLRVDEALGHFEAAINLAPGSVAAKAMLATAYVYSGQVEGYADMIGALERLTPETPEDYLFLGAAFVGAHPDTSKAVSLLERAKQKRPSGITFLQLALAEGFHAIDVGSWPLAQKAMDHCEWASEILGPEYPMVLTVRLNACNSAVRLCPEGEKASVLEKAAKAARALESNPNPIGRMQRAFYFQMLGDEEAAVQEWRQVIQHAGPGLYASYYAAAMFGRGRSAEALETLNRMESTDALTAVARACLLLDQRQPKEAEVIYQHVAVRARSLRLLGETIPLLTGDATRVVTNCTRLLEAIPAQHPNYPALQFLAGQSSRREFQDRSAAFRVQRCSVHHWIALRSLAQGDRKTARDHFAQSVETGAYILPVLHWSRAFLARLEADPRWPPWITRAADQ